MSAPAVKIYTQNVSPAVHQNAFHAPMDLVWIQFIKHSVLLIFVKLDIASNVTANQLATFVAMVILQAWIKPFAPFHLAKWKIAFIAPTIILASHALMATYSARTALPAHLYATILTAAAAWLILHALLVKMDISFLRQLDTAYSLVMYPIVPLVTYQPPAPAVLVDISSAQIEHSVF